MLDNKSVILNVTIRNHQHHTTLRAQNLFRISVAPAPAPAAEASSTVFFRPNVTPQLLARLASAPPAFGPLLPAPESGEGVWLW